MAGIVLVQEQNGFGLKIEGSLAQRLLADIRQQQIAISPGAVSSASRTRIRKRTIKLEDPPVISPESRRTKRRLKFDER